MVRVVLGTSYAEVDSVAWDALVGDGSPFLEHAFLAGLETLGCACPQTGWQPRPVLVWDDEGPEPRLIAAAPGWIKAHSLGEFVYDQGWAQAAERAGYRYYPKWVVGVPFTPVTGSRLLYSDARGREALLAGLDAAAAETCGAHVLFDTDDDDALLAEHGYFSRLQFQYHWTNRGYRSFDDFLGDFTSRDRNKIRRERREVASLRFTVGEAPDAPTLDHLYDFYADTTDRYYYGQRYLTRDFFRYLGEVWGHRLHTVLAHDHDGVLAGTLNVRKGARLYGRYWGARKEVDFLHFEVCYYQTIDYAIATGLEAFEPGHGGDHKYRRGFLPTITRSSHRFADARLQAAFGDYAAREAEAVREEVDRLRAESPLRGAR
jgi:predicted N-acyltransferase